MSGMNHEQRNREDVLRRAEREQRQRGGDWKSGTYATPAKNLRQTRRRAPGVYGSPGNRFVLRFMSPDDQS